ncbi:hypothetical protein FIBSPDRAFT_929145 [Athelia psychrophila]|uniref:Uncharacterized protein n=1 Tax=Athelia psychrophila TaxID=1759441 RepID=A0A166P4U8_9AGAM|nr:hypothetical protein FIBSPDRAFT_929145 [Fibularhizoctonia sp. CBS 109695]
MSGRDGNETRQEFPGSQPRRGQASKSARPSARRFATKSALRPANRYDRALPDGNERPNLGQSAQHGNGDRRRVMFLDSPPPLSRRGWQNGSRGRVFGMQKTSSTRPGSGMVTQRNVIHPPRPFYNSMSEITRGRNHQDTQISLSVPPAKSTFLQSNRALEEETWNRSFLSAKSSLSTGPGPRYPPRVLSGVMSSSRHTSRGSVSGDCISADDIAPVFVGPGMSVEGPGVNRDVIMEDATQRRALLSNQEESNTQMGRKTISRKPPIVIDIETSESSEAPDSEESSSESDHEDTLGPGITPSSSLIQKLEAFTLPTRRMQETKSLPFLIRNLRVGFINRCRSIGVSTGPVDDNISLRIVFRVEKDRGLADLEYSDEYKQTQSNTFACPLCNLHGKRLTWATLRHHLEWDHREFKMRCIPEGSSWKIIILILDASTWDASTDHNSNPAPFIHSEPLNQLEPIFSNIELSEPRHHSPYKVTDGGVTILQPSPKSVDVITIQDSPVPLKLKNRSPSPTGTLSPTPSTRSRSQTAASSYVYTRDNSQAGSEVLLGPSTEYLSSSSDRYSCRPGGTRLYDILDDLSLSEHGILSWYIIDREDEIIELDDVLDEDKVIQALWGRWIMLHQ